MEQRQVVIAGAGPVGLALAIGLARCGVSSLVLEKKPALSEHSKALVILPRTLQVFQSWKIVGEFLDKGVSIEKFAPVNVATGTRVVNLDLAILSDLTPMHRAIVMPQDRTERILLDIARRLPQIEVRFSCEVLGLAQDADGLRVDFTSSNGDESVRCQYLAGCDGAHSVVRHSLGLHLEGKTYPLQILLGDIIPSGGRHDLPGPRVSARKRGLLAAIRFDEKHWRIIDAAPSVGTRPAAEELDAAARELFGAGGYETTWVSEFKIHERMARRFRVGRILLLGDAAHLNSPAGGQGMNGGIQDAHNAAWKIAAVLNGASDSLLGSYEQERQFAVRVYLHPITDRLTNFVLGTPAQVRNALVIAATAAFQFPMARRAMAMGLGMMNTAYGPSSALQPHAYVGTIMPDLAFSAGNRISFLYERLYPKAALLLFDKGNRDPWPLENWQRAFPDLDVIRVVPPMSRSGTQTATEEAWWKFGTIETRAVLVRPDGYIGWQRRKPVLSEALLGVNHALGLL